MIAEKTEQSSDERVQISLYFLRETIEKLERMSRMQDTPRTVLIRRAVLRAIEDAGL
jgi:hypothetical protein